MFAGVKTMYGLYHAKKVYQESFVFLSRIEVSADWAGGLLKKAVERRTGYLQSKMNDTAAAKTFVGVLKLTAQRKDYRLLLAFSDNQMKLLNGILDMDNKIHPLDARYEFYMKVGDLAQKSASVIQRRLLSELVELIANDNGRIAKAKTWHIKHEPHHANSDGLYELALDSYQRAANLPLGGLNNQNAKEKVENIKQEWVRKEGAVEKVGERRRAASLALAEVITAMSL